MGAEVISSRPYTVGYTVIKNFYDYIQTSSRTKEWSYEYNTNKKSNMTGISLEYNGNTKNSAISKKQLQNLDKLTYIGNTDWEGDRSEPVSKIVIDRAKFFISGACIQPELFQTSRNTIQMQYELEDRSYMEFEIYEDKVICMIVPKRDYVNARFYELKDVDVGCINKYIREFYGL